MQERVLKVAEELFGEEVTSSSKIGDFERWDSLGHLNLFMALEREFRVSFTSDEILNNDTIEKITNLVKKKIK